MKAGVKTDAPLPPSPCGPEDGPSHYRRSHPHATPGARVLLEVPVLATRPNRACAAHFVLSQSAMRDSGWGRACPPPPGPMVGGDLEVGGLPTRWDSARRGGPTTTPETAPTPRVATAPHARVGRRAGQIRSRVDPEVVATASPADSGSSSPPSTASRGSSAPSVAPSAGRAWRCASAPASPRTSAGSSSRPASAGPPAPPSATGP